MYAFSLHFSLPPSNKTPIGDCCWAGMIPAPALKPAAGHVNLLAELFVPISDRHLQFIAFRILILTVPTVFRQVYKRSSFTRRKAVYCRLKGRHLKQ